MPPLNISQIRSVSSEFVGTFAFLFIGLGSVRGYKASGFPGSPMFAAAPGFGAGLAGALYATSGHLNPAVTIAAAALRKIGVLEAAAYVVAQLLAATLATCLLYVGTPEGLQGNMGATTISAFYTQGHAFLLETVGTAILAFVVWHTAVNPRTRSNVAPMAIGLTVGGLHLLLVDTSGASLNPARSFGPSLVMGEWQDFWVYWIGPIVGALMGSGIYELAYMINETPVPALSAV